MINLLEKKFQKLEIISLQKKRFSEHGEEIKKEYKIDEADHSVSNTTRLGQCSIPTRFNNFRMHCKHFELKYYKEAITRKEACLWKIPINIEMQNLKKKYTTECFFLLL